MRRVLLAAARAAGTVIGVAALAVFAVMDDLEARRRARQARP